MQQTNLEHERTRNFSSLPEGAQLSQIPSAGPTYLDGEIDVGLPRHHLLSLQNCSPEILYIPDSHIPDPHRLSSTPPGLSSAGSSSTSNRSSAYNSSGSALNSNDYDRVHMMSGVEGEIGIAVGIASGDVSHIFAEGSARSSSTGRVPIEHTRWSEYSTSIRSRSSSVGYSNVSSLLESSKSRENSSFDLEWKTVDEKDEAELMTSDEADRINDTEDSDADSGNEPTSAVMIAEQGRGLILKADGTPIVQLSVEPGTTHLLIGSSSTPNALPSFLTVSLPQICNTLLALDISANFLVALPPALASCRLLEEINISSNPLRVLPVFLNQLFSLRVLIADSTGINSLPISLCELDKLHTLSMRRNKMLSLPSWLCLLPSLQALYLDGNPFRGPWQALVEPLIIQTPTCPTSPSLQCSWPVDKTISKGSSIGSDSEELESSCVDYESSITIFPQGEDSSRPPPNLPLEGSTTNTSIHVEPQTPARRLVRTRTAPNRAFSGKARQTNSQEVGCLQDYELRKMKSTGELKPSCEGYLEPLTLSPSLLVAQSTTSVSSSNMLSMANLRPRVDRPAVPKRFASLGVYSGFEADSTRSPVPQRPGYDDEDNTDNAIIIESPSNISVPQEWERGLAYTHGKQIKDKTGRWGFLKKMSMGKIKADPNSAVALRSTIAHDEEASHPPAEMHHSTSPYSTSPHIEVRFSTTGSLGRMVNSASPMNLPTGLERRTESIPRQSIPLPVDPQPMNSMPKRRSFLPVDGSVDIPMASIFDHSRNASVDDDVYRKKGKDGASYTRALRSIMAYLKDMNDLGLSPKSNSSVSRSLSDLKLDRNMSSRHSSAVDNRTDLEGSNHATAESGIVTTDSGGSLGERKYKDDKNKRWSIVREIIETERTYVKGLQELVDIYIKPSTGPANLISGVGSSKETMIPAVERKIVFSGIEALFSFHKENFLPALEMASAPVMESEHGSDSDINGQLSIGVAKAVAGIFLKHAAFMKMYSTYINNCDNSAQRIRYWTAERLATVIPTSFVSAQGIMSDTPASSNTTLTTSQRKRIKSFLKRCRINPRHSQLNLEGYLLLPVQRIPRYRLLLEELLRSTPPSYSLMDDSLDRAVAEISSLANNMNEGKRESESRRKLVHWQARIRGRFPSPLVQPHRYVMNGPPFSKPDSFFFTRRLIMDGPLLLTRVVRKTVVSFEIINAQGDASTVQVDCLAPELTPRSLIGILCNDLLVLCRDPSEGNDPLSHVDLWAVLRMQTLPQPASIKYNAKRRQAIAEWKHKREEGPNLPNPRQAPRIYCTPPKHHARVPHLPPAPPGSPSILRLETPLSFKNLPANIDNRDRGQPPHITSGSDLTLDPIPLHSITLHTTIYYADDVVFEDLDLSDKTG
ncbi:hypothetical protein SERLA73DRAFT_68489 [Serpula lacrymans var. lacrymans S7.3]|uniref:DH domain-containing protein n=2 Tax=Serpula lacrymans var. lacrymans TaxID=341189 RepID=F8PGC1_SERL3|nr:uncharacterized protein SERLADRAFT_432245 [Serpula lacrymans var. lacrymans S7.9]EGO04828.1 hypothetical protein SERLA73DRAFT_68489 [Serpula lacrymans var. lacrymans S7.3]EGO30655.1 hypothetical protein SERLADRAFT_432245 [Serpula lacrymans var. lacrymans S7.9]